MSIETQSLLIKAYEVYTSRLCQQIWLPTDQPSSNSEPSGPSHQPNPTQITSTLAQPEFLLVERGLHRRPRVVRVTRYMNMEEREAKQVKSSKTSGQEQTQEKPPAIGKQNLPLTLIPNMTPSPR
ncbi:hypothetical protein RJT34_27840 [Clitoria ternatea]|uniref:Uncharacterized protein n=1 Tax=Clitoria ternatea TaxID=43366 RepID=A0AAN9FAF5_CLITE